MGRRGLTLASLLICARLASAGAPARAGEPATVRADGIELTSTASATVTKPVAERIRRQLARYRAFLPPRTAGAPADAARLDTASRELRIRLYGTLVAYQAAVAERGLRVGNPACYLPAEHTILLGFDGAKFDDVLAASTESSAKAAEEKDVTARRFAESQKAEEKRFRSNNVPENVRKEILQRLKQDFQQANAAADRKQKEAEKLNQKRFDEATARLLALADHELFHAYVESEVYPRDRGGLPPWLDEGLAQFVEHARWRGDQPLVDTRPQELVRRLRDEMHGSKDGAVEPMSVAGILALEGKHYLVGKGDASTTANSAVANSDDVRRRYLFAWALVQMLAETKRLAPREALDRYVDDRESDPTARLAQWVKKSPTEFEAEWRTWLAKVVR